MPWWSWLWVGAMVVVTIGGALFDRKDHEPAWFIILTTANGLACAVFVLNYFGVVRLGNLAVAAGACLALLLYEIWNDANTGGTPRTRERDSAAVLLLLMFVPAVVLGVLGR